LPSGSACAVLLVAVASPCIQHLFSKLLLALSFCKRVLNVDHTVCFFQSFQLARSVLVGKCSLVEILLCVLKTVILLLQLAKRSGSSFESLLSHAKCVTSGADVLDLDAANFLLGLIDVFILFVKSL
jgi:hypothetical protein